MNLKYISLVAMMVLRRTMISIRSVCWTRDSAISRVCPISMMIRELLISISRIKYNSLKHRKLLSARRIAKSFRSSKIRYQKWFVHSYPKVMELSQRLKQEQDYNLCRVCKERDINSVKKFKLISTITKVFLECGHRCCCYNCSIRLSVC